MIKITKTSMLLAALLFSTAAFAGAEEGHELFEEAKCMECHNVEDFANSKKVKTKKQLNGRVQGCQLNNDAGWFDEDTEDVATYLNDKYYHLKK